MTFEEFLFEYHQRPRKTFLLDIALRHAYEAGEEDMKAENERLQERIKELEELIAAAEHGL